MSRKVVLVTGCSQGRIGFHLCERFAEQGCTVYATSRRLETMEGFKHPVERPMMDVTRGIDIVVNNAGAIAIGLPGRLFGTSTFSILRVAKAVIPSTVERKQVLVVNIGRQFHALSDVLAMGCKPFGVKVMLVAPGAVKSNISTNQAAALELSSTTIFKAYFSGVREEACLPMDFARSVVAKAAESQPSKLYVAWGQLTSLYILTLAPLIDLHWTHSVSSWIYLWPVSILFVSFST
ncbi:oxidoreductase [Suillus ampliporus]|nr:oxidoreductase [Suillus ampliporus]